MEGVISMQDKDIATTDIAEQVRQARLGVDLPDRRAMLKVLGDAVLEHEDAWAAVVRNHYRKHDVESVDCWCSPTVQQIGDFGPAITHRDDDDPERRLCRAQLELADAYRATARLYRPESPTRAAMVNACSYLEFAANAAEFAADVRAERAAARKARVAS